jgi:hypothetical protein
MTLFVITVVALLVLGAWGRLREQIVTSRIGAIDDLRARTKADVLGAMGSPNARAELASGGEVLDWRVRGMHLTLMFDAGGQCVGVTRCSY